MTAHGAAICPQGTPAAALGSRHRTPSPARRSVGLVDRQGPQPRDRVSRLQIAGSIASRVSLDHGGSSPSNPQAQQHSSASLSNLTVAHSRTPKRPLCKGDGIRRTCCCDRSSPWQGDDRFRWSPMEPLESSFGTRFTAGDRWNRSSPLHWSSSWSSNARSRNSRL